MCEHHLPLKTCRCSHTLFNVSWSTPFTLNNINNNKDNNTIINKTNKTTNMDNNKTNGLVVQKSLHNSICKKNYYNEVWVGQGPRFAI